MNFIQILILAVIQGAAELLPVSSSAHVIFAAKLMGLDPSAPAMTFLLVMLHTGTMFAVLAYFWRRWAGIWSAGGEPRKTFLLGVILATGVTGALGLGLKAVIEKLLLARGGAGEVEELFRDLPIIAIALSAAGVLILISSVRARETGPLTIGKTLLIGLVQAVCLPFRGFSRSGATISTGMLLGVSKALSEDFSFALAVALTPPVIVHSLRRLLKASAGTDAGWGDLLGPGLLGMAFSFIAGWLALKWLSSWLERGRWHWFGVYCLGFAAVLAAYHFMLPH